MTTRRASVGGGAASPCPGCGGTRLRSFFAADSVPVHCNVLHTDATSARAAPRGAMVLVFCEQCGLVFNLAFDAGLTAYSSTYENSLYFSEAFQDYADTLTSHLVDSFALRDKDLIEIGCGSAEFLNDLCEKGDNRGHGFDPSAPPSRFPRVTIIPEFYGPDHAGYPVDAVFSRHVLEHVDAPLAFLAGVRQAVTAATPMYCEVPNARFILSDLSIWDVIYEHHSYFARESIENVIRRAGFHITDSYSSFGDQFLSVEALASAPEAPPPTDLTELSELVDAFGTAHREKVQFWEQRCRDWNQSGTQVALWGAGSKGVTFLNTISEAGAIESIVDINPRKQGKFIPGTGHQVVSPASVAAARPDVVLVMNPAYRSEIATSLGELELRAEIETV